ncbi:MAG: alanine racemase C-terminal domain-containing protein [Hoeflea sp.]|nr:alanine racemase C-terminal domain-containing protein [Hoeflea sp.]
MTDIAEDAISAGDWIELLGPTISLEEASRAAGTISYEMLTSLGRRANRHYIG